MIITSRALGLIQCVISVLCVQNVSINTEICYKILAYSKLLLFIVIHNIFNLLFQKQGIKMLKQVSSYQ